MRVLQIIPIYEPAWHMGGVVRSISQLCRGLASSGVDVTVYTTDSSGISRLNVPTSSLQEIGGVKVFYFKADWSLKFSYSKDLAKACRETIADFDLVHLNSLWNYPSIPAAVEARRSRVPYIESAHGSLSIYAMPGSSIKKRLYLSLFVKPRLNRASAIHYTTELEREKSSHLNIKAPSFIVPNGLDPKEFEVLPNPEESRRKFGVDANQTVITYLGRLHKSKGVDVLLYAFAKVAPIFPLAILLLAGPDDGYEQTLRRMVQDLGLHGRVQFPGFVESKGRTDLFSATNLFVLISPGENFGNSAVEAMASGLPVLLSNNVGIYREVIAEEAGFSVPFQIESVAVMLRELLSDQSRLKTTGERARRFAKRFYSIQLITEKMVAAYQDVIDNTRNPRLGWRI